VNWAPVSVKHGVDIEGAILDQVFQEGIGDGLRHTFMQFHIGILAHPINPDE